MAECVGNPVRGRVSPDTPSRIRKKKGSWLLGLGSAAYSKAPLGFFRGSQRKKKKARGEGIEDLGCFAERGVRPKKKEEANYEEFKSGLHLLAMGVKEGEVIRGAKPVGQVVQASTLKAMREGDAK